MERRDDSGGRMMQEPSTPSFLGRKRKLKSPGDLLGSGKTQQSILKFLSPSSSSEKTSSSCSSTPQRASVSDCDQDASVSSKLKSKRSKKKQRSKNVSAKRRLSLIELSSDEESLCDNDQTKNCVNKCKESKDLSKKCMESEDVTNECKDRFENVKRNLFVHRDEPMSQTFVVLGSSEDSDFELHTSKKSHDFSSQCLVRQSHSTVEEDQHLSTSNLKPSRDLQTHPSTSAKTPRRPVVFATSTPNNERTPLNEGLQNAGSISVKIEESELNESNQDDVTRYSLNGASSIERLTAVEDQSPACASNGKPTNCKLFRSKCKSYSEISKRPLFVDASSLRNENLTSGEKQHNLESFKTPILQPIAVETEEPGPDQSLERETAEDSVMELQNGDSHSTIEGDPSATTSKTKWPMVFSCSTHTEKTMASDKGLLNLELDKTPILRPVAGRVDESDTNELLQDDTAEELIIKRPGVVDDDGGEKDSFYHSRNDVGPTCLSNRQESDVSKSTINVTLISETSCNGRISDSDDSQFEGLYTRQNSGMIIDESEEGSFGILPPTPTESEGDHDPHIFENNDPNPANFNAGINLLSKSANAWGSVQDSCIFDQETNVQNSTHFNTAEPVHCSSADPSRDLTDYNFEDETNRILSSKNSNPDERLSCFATDKTNSMQLQDSGRSTPEQECETSSSSRACDVPKTNAKSSCSIESKDISNDSAVDINDEQSLKPPTKTPLQSKHSSSPDETKTEKSCNGGSSIIGALPTKADPSTSVTKADLKGVELSSKISCGVPSEPNRHVLPDCPQNSSFPASSANSYTSRRPVKEIILLDEVFSECKKFGALAFNHEPLRKFQSLYSSLIVDEKVAFHSILLISLADGDRWQRCHDHLRKHMDRLASMNLVQYIGEHEDSLKLIDKLTNLEIISIFSLLGLRVPADEADIREMLILACKDDSKFGCIEKAKDAVKAVARNKFVKIESESIFCIKMCLELISMSISFHDKVYRSVDIARHFGEIVRSNVIHLLPLQLDTSTNLINSEQEYNEFLDFCKLKAVFESGRLEDTSWVNISASIAVFDYSSEQNVLLKDSPLLRSIYTNMVYILDEELKRKILITSLDGDFDGMFFFILGILLKQDFAGFGLKAVWSKKKVKCFNKLFSTHDADELSDILQQNISAVEYIIRSEFVSGLLESKNSWFSTKKKSDVTKYLRPKIHRKVLVENCCRKSDVGIVNYKVFVSGRKVRFRRPCLFDKYGPDFKYGLLDSGMLLLNAVCLVFWPVIYANLGQAFVSRYQKGPLDWGSKSFYSKRRELIQSRMASIEQLGIQGVIDETKCLIDKFRGYHSIVDWTLVTSTAKEMYSILEILGLTKFSQIANHLLQHLDERQIGLPDLVVWNDSPPKIKFVAFRKPSDPLHPHQVVWLEKLSELGVDAEECQILPKITKLQTPADLQSSQFPSQSIENVG